MQGLNPRAISRLKNSKNDRGEIEAREGDFVSVAIEALENGFGETRLSRDKAKRLNAWYELEEAMEKRQDRYRHGQRGR